MKKEIKNGSSEPTFTKIYDNIYKLNVIDSLTVTDIMVLSKFISYFESVDDVYISDKTISKQFNNLISEQTVYRTVKKLDELGLLNKITIPNPDNGGKTRYIDIPNHVMITIYGNTYTRRVNSGKKYNYYLNNAPESLPIKKEVSTPVEPVKVQQKAPNEVKKEVIQPTPTPVAIEDELSKDEIIELFENLIPNSNGGVFYNRISKNRTQFKSATINEIITVINDERKFLKSMKDSTLTDSGIDEMIEKIKEYKPSEPEIISTPEPIEIINSTPEPEIITTPVELKKDVKDGTIDDLFKLFEKKEDKNEILLDDLVDVEMMNEYTNQDDDVNEKLPWDN